MDRYLHNKAALLDLLLRVHKVQEGVERRKHALSNVISWEIVLFQDRHLESL